MRRPTRIFELRGVPSLLETEAALYLEIPKAAVAASAAYAATYPELAFLLTPEERALLTQFGVSKCRPVHAFTALGIVWLSGVYHTPQTFSRAQLLVTVMGQGEPQAKHPLGFAPR